VDLRECVLVADDPIFTGCWEFNDQFQFDWPNIIGMTNSEDPVMLVGGNSSYDSSNTKPNPIYRRGLYFDGVDDYMRFVEFSIPLSHTIEMWVFCMGPPGTVDDNTLDYTLFSISNPEFSTPHSQETSGFGSEDFYSIEVVPFTTANEVGSDSTLLFKYYDAFYDKRVINPTNEVTDINLFHKWNHIAFRVDF